MGDIEKLDRLKKLDEGNRARSKKYLDKIKANGKRQVSIILDNSTIDELILRRDQSIKTGQALTFGNIIESVIDVDINVNKDIKGDVKMKTTDIQSVIKIDTDKKGIRTVNARGLHGFLEVKTAFDVWIRRRIAEYDFQNHCDYVVIIKKDENPIGGRPLTEYHISLDMAKELSMVERNEKGKQARQYFIECERIAKEMPVQPQIPDFTNPAIAARAWADEVDKKLIAEKIVLDQKPRMDVLNRIATADGLLGLMESAKHLQVRYVDLKKWVLLPDMWIYQRAGSKNWLGYQNKINQGLLEHKVTTTNIGGVEMIHTQVKVTPKGLLRLAYLLDNLK